MHYTQGYWEDSMPDRETVAPGDDLFRKKKKIDKYSTNPYLGTWLSYEKKNKAENCNFFMRH